MKNKPRIMVVDDNENLCNTMSLILGRKGYAVTTTQDGPEAIKRAKEIPFDVIFLDIKMVPMNGVETYKRIKSIRPEVMVIMMTAYAVEDLVQEALEEGAHGIIYKPLDIEQVLTLIEEAREVNDGAVILVVDDDDGTCITLRNTLVRKGYSVSVAHTGEEAVFLAQENTYDVIFIDVRLPTLNGLETYLAVREINPEAVVIMITAYRQEAADLVEEALTSSAYTCLYKPLEMKEVLRLVKEICGRNQEVRGKVARSPGRH